MRTLARVQSRVMCDLCGETTAVHYCEICTESACAACSAIHKKMKLTRSHAVTKLAIAVVGNFHSAHTGTAQLAPEGGEGIATAATTASACHDTTAPPGDQTVAALLRPACPSPHPADKLLPRPSFVKKDGALCVSPKGDAGEIWQQQQMIRCSDSHSKVG